MVRRSQLRSYVPATTGRSGVLPGGTPGRAGRREPAGSAEAAQRSRATRQTASSATSTATSRCTPATNRQSGRSPGAARGQAGPGVADPAGGHHRPSRPRSSTAAGRASRRPARRRRTRRRAGRRTSASRARRARRSGASCQIAQPPLRPQLGEGPVVDLLVAEHGRRRAPSCRCDGFETGAEVVGTGCRGRVGRFALGEAVLAPGAVGCEGRPPSPRALPTRPPRSTRCSMMARARRLSRTAEASRCHHVIRL